MRVQENPSFEFHQVKSSLGLFVFCLYFCIGKIKYSTEILRLFLFFDVIFVSFMAVSLLKKVVSVLVGDLRLELARDDVVLIL